MQRAGDQSFWGIGVPSIFGNMSEQPASGEANASAAVFGGGNRIGHGTGWWWHTPDDTLDKIEEAILVRDTKIYLQVVWRLLTDHVLPLDYAEHGHYLQRELAALQTQVGDRFDLTELVHRAEALTEKAERLAALRRDAADPQQVARLNRCLMELSRALVPNDYTTGERFEQDPALSSGPVPALQPVAELATLDPESNAYKFLTVGMTRARNKVGWALKHASDILDRYLDQESALQARA